MAVAPIRTVVANTYVMDCCEDQPWFIAVMWKERGYIEINSWQFFVEAMCRSSRCVAEQHES